MMPQIDTSPITATPTPTRKRNSPAGFTLIELLTVIAIIGILAAILIPTIGQVRDKAKESKCLSNLKQIGVSVLCYANDNKRQFPYFSYNQVDPITNKTITVNWPDTLRNGGYLPLDKNVVNDSIFYCPTSTQDRTTATWSTPDYAAPQRSVDGIGKQGVFSNGTTIPLVPALKLAQVLNPPKVLMMVDSCTPPDVYNGLWDGTLSNNITVANVAAGTSFLGNRHGYNGPGTGRFSALFCDGHVEAISISDSRLQNQALITNMLTPY